jgi:hypothetical protein
MPRIVLSNERSANKLPMKISLIHPSRGRAKKSRETTLKWMSSTKVPTELIVSCDTDDRCANEYLSLYPNECIMSNNTSVVEATNKAAAISTGDILVYLSDDFDCFENWGEALINEFEKYAGPALIKVDDCLQKFHVRVLTIPIMNRLCFSSLGYFWHPGYKSMFVDEHLYWRTRKLGFLKSAPHIKFEHRHVSVGKAENDETYRRSAANWEHGKSLFAIHKSIGFTS